MSFWKRRVVMALGKNVAPGETVRGPGNVPVPQPQALPSPRGGVDPSAVIEPVPQEAAAEEARSKPGDQTDSGSDTGPGPVDQADQRSNIVDPSSPVVPDKTPEPDPRDAAAENAKSESGDQTDSGPSQRPRPDDQHHRKSNISSTPVKQLSESLNKLVLNLETWKTRVNGGYKNHACWLLQRDICHVLYHGLFECLLISPDASDPVSETMLSHANDDQKETIKWMQEKIRNGLDKMRETRFDLFEPGKFEETFMHRDFNFLLVKYTRSMQFKLHDLLTVIETDIKSGSSGHVFEHRNHSHADGSGQSADESRGQEEGRGERDYEQSFKSPRDAASSGDDEYDGRLTPDSLEGSHKGDRPRGSWIKKNSDSDKDDEESDENAAADQEVETSESEFDGTQFPDGQTGNIVDEERQARMKMESFQRQVSDGREILDLHISFLEVADHSRAGGEDDFCLWCPDVDNQERNLFYLFMDEINLVQEVRGFLWEHWPDFHGLCSECIEHYEKSIARLEPLRHSWVSFSKATDSIEHLIEMEKSRLYHLQKLKESNGETVLAQRLRMLQSSQLLYKAWKRASIRECSGICTP